MNAKPNRTVLRARIQAIRPQPDGWGADVDLEVLGNESPSIEADFLRPVRGDVLQVFAAEPGALEVGRIVRAEAELAGGPFGRRAILSAIALATE